MRTLLVCIVVGALAISGCERKTEAGRGGPDIVGEGATFPRPLYEIWVQKYAMATGTRVFYRATGSSHGIETLMRGGADFAGTEAPLTDEQIERLGDVVHVPVSVAPVAVAYNSRKAPSLPDGLHFTP